MPVYETILDTILNTSNHASYDDSPDLGDAFLDSDATSRGKMLTKSASSLESNGILGDVVAQTAKTAKAAKLLTIPEAISYVNGLVTKNRKQANQSKIGRLVEAANRLRRLAAKTPAQMKQDGATKLADYLDQRKVPAWAKQANTDLALISATKHAAQKRTAKVAEEKPSNIGLSDQEIKDRIHTWLNEGISPKEVKDKLKKLADLQMFNNSMAYGYLDEHAGTLGYAYIEPNHYMNDCATTVDRLTTKLGKVKAASVKQIAACKGCSYFAKSAKRCNLYRLPIVASKEDLFPIINNLTGNVKNKKAALVALANGYNSKYTPKQATKSGVKGQVLSPKKAATSEVAFTADSVHTLHKSGKTIEEIYSAGVKTAGVVKTKKALKSFIAGLKKNKTKVALSQIDCKMLVAKLGSDNAIYGEKKCASCSYRKGAHCGLTGGTLVAFPGMGKDVKTACVQDGTDFVNEFGLTEYQDDIQMIQPLEVIEIQNSEIEL